MKFKIDKKYIQIGVTVFFTVLALILVIFFIWNNGAIMGFIRKFNKALAPVFYGLIIAYILSPVLNFIENKLLIPLFVKLHLLDKEKLSKQGKKDGRVRVLSTFLTLLLMFLFIYIFFATVIPELISSVQSIIEQYPNYARTIVMKTNEIVEDNPQLQNLLKNSIYNYYSETDNMINDFLFSNIGSMLLDLSSSFLKFVRVLWNIVIGLVISIYVLFSKERFSKSCTRLCYAILETKTANRFVEAVRFTHRTFIGFLSGKVLDSMIIGIITFISLTIMGMPYSILISMIVGVTNIIPFFGPLFGAIPSVFILLMVNPKYALYFIIFILILQQFDGNILGPKILSSSTGVSTFWIICSITAFSGFFGVIGMIIAVPVTAVCFALLDSVTNGMLMKKKLPTDVDSYQSVGSINDDGEIQPYEYKAQKKQKKPSKLFTWIKNLFVKLFRKIKGLFKRKDSR